MLIRTEKRRAVGKPFVRQRPHLEDGNPTTIATPHSRFFIRRLASGNLLLVNHYKFTGRSHLTAQLSTDDGATWNDGLLLDERAGGVSYPDGVQDKDGLIWITYDRDRDGAGEILLAKFREEDVAAGKDVSGAVSLKQVVNKLDKPSTAPRELGSRAGRRHRDAAARQSHRAAGEGRARCGVRLRGRSRLHRGARQRCAAGRGRGVAVHVLRRCPS